MILPLPLDGFKELQSLNGRGLLQVCIQYLFYIFVGEAPSIITKDFN